VLLAFASNTNAGSVPRGCHTLETLRSDCNRVATAARIEAGKETVDAHRAPLQ